MRLCGEKLSADATAALEAADRGSYRVITSRGVRVREKEDLKSNHVGTIKVGEVVTVVEVRGRRARLTKPIRGWCSLHNSNGQVLLRPQTTLEVAWAEVGKEMDRLDLESC